MMGAIRRAMIRLRGVRGIEWALLAVAAAAVVLLLSGGGGRQEERTPTALEQRMENVLSCVGGAGRVRVLVNGGDEAISAFADSGGRVSGVVVVAEGADDLRVKIELQKAVQALLGLEAERVEVLGMEESPQ